MKILHIGYSDSKGGAAVAMMRIHNSLLKQKIDSHVLVAEKLLDEQNIHSFNEDFFDQKISEFKIKLMRQKKYIFKQADRYSHSLNLFSSKILKKINQIDPDIINLHWINNETISINQISKLKKPIVWTMLDMWPMCGGEHYTENTRYIEGYNNSNRDKNERGIDLNKWIWKKKIHKWQKIKFNIICISEWLKLEAKKSVIFKNEFITKINLPIDLSIWKLIEKKQARQNLSLSPNKKILLFISTNGTKDLRKGFKFVDNAMKKILLNTKDILLIIIGQKDIFETMPYDVKFFNNISSGNSEKLRSIYSSADVLLAPSILEAQGQVAVEALSCGLPTIGFRQTGLEDVIFHKETGYLAEYLDQNDFNNGLNYVLKKIESDKAFFKEHCQNFVKNNFSSEIVAKKYIDTYKRILNT